MIIVTITVDIVDAVAVVTVSIFITLLSWKPNEVQSTINGYGIAAVTYF